MKSADDGPRPTADDPNVSLVRPYLMTAGRAQPDDVPIEIEAQVLASDLGTASFESLAFEHHDIVALCRTTLAVAEIAAQLGLHIGVARVLVADLAASGYVIVRRPDTTLANDLDTIERVIRGLQAIR